MAYRGENIPLNKKPSKRQKDPVYDILFHLATHYDAPQSELWYLLSLDNPLYTKGSSDNLSDYVRALKGLGLIKVKYTIHNEKNTGLEKNILGITFKGLTVMLSWQIIKYPNEIISFNHDSVEKMIQMHSRLWIFFEEWNNIDDTFPLIFILDVNRYFKDTIYENSKILTKKLNEIKDYIEKTNEKEWLLWTDKYDVYNNLSDEGRTLMNNLSQNQEPSDSQYKVILSRHILRLNGPLVERPLDHIKPVYPTLKLWLQNPRIREEFNNHLDSIENYYSLMRNLLV